VLEEMKERENIEKGYEKNREMLKNVLTLKRWF
jgi:hypothetical protein